MDNLTHYSVETLRSGQPRPYADTEREYLMGGQSPDDLRQAQRNWAKGIVRALCQNFREKYDDDGREGLDAHFYPTLKQLNLDPQAGTIRAFIIEPYAD